jgi:hypothetical protein
MTAGVGVVEILQFAAWAFDADISNTAAPVQYTGFEKTHFKKPAIEPFNMPHPPLSSAILVCDPRSGRELPPDNSEQGSTRS